MAASEFSICEDKLGRGALRGRAGLCAAVRSLEEHSAFSPSAEALVERPAVMWTLICTLQCTKDSGTQRAPKRGELVALRSVLCTRECSREREHFSPKAQAQLHISSNCRHPIAGKAIAYHSLCELFKCSFHLTSNTSASASISNYALRRRHKYVRKRKGNVSQV